MTKKYLGPCVMCGSFESSSGRFIKKMCKACYSRMATSGNTIPHEKYRGYPGPCVNCGTHESNGGRFIKKMCKACYQRMKTTGNAVPRARYPGPCINCGSFNSGSYPYFRKQLCSICYAKYTHRLRNPLEIRRCTECGIKLVPGKKCLSRTICNNL